MTRALDEPPAIGGKSGGWSPPGAVHWALHPEAKPPEGGEHPSDEVGLLEERPVRLLCAKCRTSVSDRSMLFVATGASARAVFANPQGRVYEIVTLRHAENVLPVTEPVSEYSWFAGHAWRIVVCAGCLLHLGWSFEGTAGGALPPLFFALIAAKLVEEARDRN